MHASRAFPSSAHCKPSPDGRYVATVRSSTLTVRSVDTLRLVNVVKLAQHLSGPVCSLLWAPSSDRVLLAAAHDIHVISAADGSLRASIRCPRSAAVFFGARHTEVLTSSSSGLNFSVLDLSTSKVVEISNPKFHDPPAAARGFALRPDTGHLALLTRAGGKDVVSIHHPTSRQVQRSWTPDTLDAQGLLWTPDGRWLLLWESPAHGHGLLLYTADGQHFRTLSSSTFAVGQLPRPGPALELGVKTCQVSPDAALCAVGDHSRGVVVLSTQSWREQMRLIHPVTIVPRDTIRVWQEQLVTAGARQTPFLRATLGVSPPGPPSDTSPGCSLAGFDASSTLLATRLDDAPSTLWIWDLAAAELRAVLLFHAHVAFRWHPTSPELLLVNSLDEARRGASFVWDPLADGPTMLKPDDYLPAAKVAGRPRVAWVDGPPSAQRLLVGDAEHYALLSLSGEAEAEAEAPGSWPTDDLDSSAVDDTFAFRNA